MRRVKLDRIDLQILKDLQNNGRITNVELARRAGISAPPCLRRVRALEEAGFVRGYHADLKAEALGFDAPGGRVELPDVAVEDRRVRVDVRDEGLGGGEELF
jgi:DNA-binding Lrp family transcriptional regulator